MAAQPREYTSASRLLCPDVRSPLACQVVVPAYGKVNLALEVVGRRADGFHELRSVVVTIDWHDLVGVHLAARVGEPPGIELDGPTAQPEMASLDNLAARAAQVASELVAPPLGTLCVHLTKRLPVASGLGGGSADAAAILRAAAILGGAGDAAKLLARAQALGSDVPATLHGGTLLMEGRGERLTPIAAPGLHLAIAVAGASSTPAVYAALADAERRPDGRATRVVAALQAGRPPDATDLGSALEAAAGRVVPALAAALARLRAAIPEHHWHLTGSGGAAFAVAADAAAAERITARARALGLPARACRSIGAPLLPMS